MIAQISSPIRALILLLTLIGSFYVFNPYSTSPSSFLDTKKPPISATTIKIAQGATEVEASHNASQPTTEPSANSTPDTASGHISGDLIENLTEEAPKDPNKAAPENANKAAPKVRQATMIYETVGGNIIYERSIDTHIKHGDKWGVPTHILRHDVIEAGFFNKPAYILGLVIEEMAKPHDKRTEWIVWFDADTIILNPNVPWTVFFPPPDFDEIHILATQDQNSFNAGMVMFRVHEWTVQALSEALALRQLRPEVKFDFYDQGALRWVIERQGYEEHVIYQPHNWWNPFGLEGKPYATDAFMLHFAGVDCCGQLESKGTVMERWLDIVESTPEQYAEELEKTRLPKEVEDFWGLARKAKKTMRNADDAKDTSRELQVARSELWDCYSRYADHATNLTLAIEKVESIMSQVKVVGTKENPADKAKQEAQAKKEGESAKEKGKPAEKEEASAKQNTSTKEDVSAKKVGTPAEKEEASPTQATSAKEDVSAKKEEKPAEKEEASSKQDTTAKEVVSTKEGEPTAKEEASSKQEISVKEDVSAGKEALKAKKKAQQAEMEAAKTRKEPAPPPKNNR